MHFVGRVDWSFPLLGFLLAYLSLPSGIVFVFCLASTLIVALMVLDDFEAELLLERGGGTSAAAPDAAGRTPRGGLTQA